MDNMTMNNTDKDMITELKVIENEKTIFDSDYDYIIPLYQRGYAWEDKQLIQLIEDICDIQEGSHYYMGSLIVSKQGEKYEVVDGQQRLTSLYLLLHCLKVKVKQTLTFACRDKSNYTLLNLQEIIEENRSKLDMDQVEQNLIRGLQILNEELERIPFSREVFLEKLSGVIIYRIEVPKFTDLNRYFEIMNTRGEQLEQHDILKATLMGYLDALDDNDTREKNCFASIWDACSDMTGYVQMHFVSKKNAVRDFLFGESWNGLPTDRWEDLVNNISAEEKVEENNSILQITKVNSSTTSFDGNNDDDDDTRIRFESIIDFPFFLLHTLKVYLETCDIKHLDGSSKIIDELLDDKKLLETFIRVINEGTINGEPINNKQNLARFSKGFIICLLRTRYIFDKYILKREFLNDNSDGEWSLKSLDVSSDSKSKKPYYKNTLLSNKGEWYQDSKNPARVKESIMIQSALRVSYTSPKVMHWITELLKWLSRNEYSNLNKLGDFSSVIESIAKKAVKENFFEKCNGETYAMGVNTPHIVFNYLDYLLWKDNKRDYDNFVFEFRNSVEHWYPQNPSEGTFERWENGVDSFGNLCIIQRSVNSKFSNMSPEAKKSTYYKEISKGSLKLRKMSELTVGDSLDSASMRWKKTVYKQHENEMILLLKRNCGIDQNEEVLSDNK